MRGAVHPLTNTFSLVQEQLEIYLLPLPLKAVCCGTDVQFL